MSLIEDLQWRHAVKAYDPTKKVSEDKIDKIVEATRLAPTSSGLQQFRVIIISDQEIKDKLVAGSFNPKCMRDCSHVIVFAAWDKYTAERIDKVYNFITDERGLARGTFNSYTVKLKAIYSSQSNEDQFAHAAKQTYIAMGLALAQAAELRVDTTPIEGFDSNLVDKVLELEKFGLKSVSLIYIGYADKDKDWLGAMKKVRIPTDEFVIRF